MITIGKQLFVQTFLPCFCFSQCVSITHLIINDIAYNDDVSFSDVCIIFWNPFEEVELGYIDFGLTRRNCVPVHLDIAPYLGKNIAFIHICDRCGTFEKSRINFS